MIKNKTITFINDNTTEGGTEVFVANLSNKWCKNNKIFVVTNNKDKKFYDFYSKKIKHLYRNRVIWRNLRYFGNLINRMQDWRINRIVNKSDVAIFVKISVTSNYVQNCKAKKKLGWCHGDLFTNPYEQEAFKNNNIDKNLLEKFDKVICVSKRSKESVIHYCGDPKNIIVSANPVLTNKIIEKSQEAIEMPKKKSTRFVTISRLDKEKGFDLLLHVFNKLDKENYDFELFIIGEGEEKNNIDRYINNNNLSNKIKLLGYKENPYPYYKTADWFILTSKSEGYSFAMQEAAILDLPIIITDVSGAKDLLGDDNEYGLITQINEDSIYDTVKKVLDNPDLQNFYKKQIIKRKEIINFDRRIKDIEELL